MEKLDKKVVDRARGGLLGLIAGNSLESYFSWDMPALFEQFFVIGEDVPTMKDGGFYGIMAGQVTDAGELALALARTICEARRYDGERVAKAYRRWCDSEPWGTAPLTQVSISFLGRPGDSREIAESSECLARVAPIGIWGAGHTDDEVADAARADATLSHSPALVRLVNEIFAVGMAHAVRGESVVHVFASMKERVESTVASAHDRKVVRRALEDALEEPLQMVKTGSPVLVALQNAVHCLLHISEDVKGLREMVEFCGGAYSCASAAFALWGAIHGASAAIPPQWQDAILSCRPGPKNASRTKRQRPPEYWPCDVDQLVMGLLGAAMK